MRILKGRTRGDEHQIEAQYTEYAIEHKGEIIYITDDENEARLFARANDDYGLLSRTVFETPWEPVI